MVLCFCRCQAEELQYSKHSMNGTAVFFFVGSFLLCEDYRYRKELLHIKNHTSSNTGSRCSVLLVGGAVEGHSVVRGHRWTWYIPSASC